MNEMEVGELDARKGRVIIYQVGTGMEGTLTTYSSR
jgi:hypothetical protein